jgi:hypothetical protein
MAKKRTAQGWPRTRNIRRVVAETRGRDLNGRRKTR